jgi:hypothetical protein
MLPIVLLALAIALVVLTVKQYTRSLLSTVGDSSVGDSSVGVLCTLGRTFSTVEVHAAGLVLPVAVGVRWDSLLW